MPLFGPVRADVPDGTYLARVQSVDEKFTEEHDYQMVLHLVIEAGPLKGARLCMDRLTLSAKAGWIARKKLGALLRLADDDPCDVKGDDVRGAIAHVTVARHEYNGKHYLQPTGGPENNFGYQAIEGPPRPSAEPSPPDPELDDCPF